MDFCCLLAISLAHHHPFHSAVSLGIHGEYWAGELTMYFTKLI